MAEQRQRLRAHVQRLGWTQQRLADWLSEQTGDRISVYTVRSWLVDVDRAYARTCPGWPSRLIELVRPS